MCISPSVIMLFCSHKKFQPGEQITILCISDMNTGFNCIEDKYTKDAASCTLTSKLTSQTASLFFACVCSPCEICSGVVG